MFQCSRKQNENEKERRIENISQMASGLGKAGAYVCACVCVCVWYVFASVCLSVVEADNVKVCSHITLAKTQRNLSV